MYMMCGLCKLGDVNFAQSSNFTKEEGISKSFILQVGITFSMSFVFSFRAAFTENLAANS